MLIALDTEFNGFDGELLTLALVAYDGRYWYGSLKSTKPLVQWVKDNVMPVVGDVIEYPDRQTFRVAMFKWLRQYNTPTIVADWPTDIAHFINLYAGDKHDEAINYNCNFKLDMDIEYESKVPHNALYDAKAIMDNLQG